LFQRFETQLAHDPRAGRNLRALHCLPEQLDSQIRDHEIDAVIVIEPRFWEGLPGSVRHWKGLRPDLQALFMFRRLPERRDLVELMRAGAFDVIDTEIEALGAPLIQQVLNELVRRLEEIQVGGFERDQARDTLARVGLIGESTEMQSLFVQAQQAAAQSSPVLISGEPGSGKRLLAHAIHAIGPRSPAQIVTVDCLSLSPTLLGASLFGAGSQGCGPMLWAAERGTLLLNEVSEMPHGVQEQFQKTLESPDAAPDVRFISTTSRRMEQLVEAGTFRQDLCYRLNVLPIEVPPLRRRLLDVPLLARYFLSRLEREGRALALSEEAAGALSRYHWPGNVRELKEALASAAIRSAGEEILPSHLPGAITRVERGEADEAAFSSSELNLERLERQAILRALQISGFDKTRAARLLGIGKTTMYRKLKEMSGKPRA
jgi:DNA-binding NtrC family response regulator